MNIQINNRRGGCIGCALSFLVFFCIGGVAVLFVFGIGGALRGSEPYQLAVAEAVNDEQVIAVLGEPVRDGWFFSGSIQTSASSGEASFEIPLRGSEERGTLYVVASKNSDGWRFSRLEVVVRGSGERISLVTTTGR